jgi:hypothetical protein
MKGFSNHYFFNIKGLFGITLDALDSEGRKSLTQKTMVKDMVK